MSIGNGAHFLFKLLITTKQILAGELTICLVESFLFSYLSPPLGAKSLGTILVLRYTLHFLGKAGVIPSSLLHTITNQSLTHNHSVSSVEDETYERRQ